MVDIIEHMTQYTVVVPESIQLLVGNVTPILAMAYRRGRKQHCNLFDVGILERGTSPT